jgi:2-amino-4-hydroxy-6-hydroxymethyldihydropteridine diphosphokinase
MTAVYVAAGSNVDPERNLASACQQMADSWPDARFSPAYRNRAVGFDGPDFLNMVVEFHTTESVETVLARLRDIEVLCGRPRNSPKWASRAMDLDILLFGARIEKTADYTLPRPDLLKRPYMLGPLAELAPLVRHPTANKSIGELWAQFDRDAHSMTPVPITLPASAR